MQELKRFRASAAILVALSLPAASACAEQNVSTPSKAMEAPSVSFSPSVVHEAPSALGRRYQVWVDLPPSYAQSDDPLPVVFVLDPHWALPATRSIRTLVGQRGRNIEDFILVGLSHDQDRGLEGQRRDFTPTDPRRGPNVAPGRYSAPSYGEAEVYRQYIETVVFPLIASNYRADMNRKILIGHSYGALFGFHVLFTRPEMFSGYVFGSPSLWFDEGVMFEREEAWARSGRGLSARIHMVTGSFETVAPGPRFNTRSDLVADMERMRETMDGRGYAGLRITSEVAQGEDHLTVFPDVVTRGLLAVLPGRGPYTGG
jgi:predicted alpha/beta superfamily hydrolase